MRPESKIDVGLAVAVGGAADGLGLREGRALGLGAGSFGLLVPALTLLVGGVEALGTAEEGSSGAAELAAGSLEGLAAGRGSALVGLPVDAVAVACDALSEVAPGGDWAGCAEASLGGLVFQAANAATPTATITAALSPSNSPLDDFLGRASVALLATTAA